MGRQDQMHRCHYEWLYNLQKRSSSARTVSLLHQSFITSYRFLKVTSHLTGILMVYSSIFSLLYNQSELNIELYWYYTCTGAPAGFTTPLKTPVALLFLVSQNSVTCMIECLTLTLSSLVVEKKPFLKISDDGHHPDNANGSKSSSLCL